jgi:hypothetical protein
MGNYLFKINLFFFDSGYRIIIIKNSTYCFCGNSYGLYGISEFCTMPCSGNASQTCGGDANAGNYANSVYFTSLSNYFSCLNLL